MQTLSIDVQLTYLHDRLSSAERAPQVHLYLETYFKRRASIVQLGREKSVHRTQVTGQIAQPEIPATYSLCMASFAWRPNDQGVPALQDTGVASVALGDIDAALQSSGSFSRDVALTMHTAQGFQKNVLQIKVTKMSGPRIVHPVVISEHVEGNANIAEYISSNVEEEQKMNETFGPSTANMRIPYDFSESGIQTTLNTPLPAVAFVMSETPESNELYWKNAFETIMARDDMRPHDFRRLNKIGQARATILTLCYAAQYMDYVGDTIDRNRRYQAFRRALVQSYENFGDALATDSGDCEDLAGVELQCYNAFTSSRFSDKTLEEMRQIAKGYVPPLSLDVVRGAQVSDEVQHYGAHMNDNFIPLKDFCAWLCRSKEGKQMVKTLPVQDIQEGLPFLVGEGTGMYEPYGYDIGVPLVGPKLGKTGADFTNRGEAMAYVYANMPSLKDAKKHLLHRKGEPGSFFVASLVGMTSYFSERGAGAPLSFWYCTKQPNNELTRGVAYADMMNPERHERIVIRPHPPLSRAAMKTIDAAIAKRVPPRPLILSENRDTSRRQKHSVLEKLRAKVAEFKRPPGSPHIYAPVYFRPHHLEMENMAARLIGDVSRLTRIWKVEYKLEEITDDLWGYRVRFYVK